MQTLLLELGAPLVFAFVLLAIAKFVRALINRNKPQEELLNHENLEEQQEESLADENEADPHST
jgi:hypothetical protein